MSAFERARRAIDAHAMDELRAELDRSPELVRARGGRNANDLLGMATATCDERLVELLLERGADPAGANVHGWTALHQAGYAGVVHLVRLLLGAGAPVDAAARGDGGTPLVVALFWGHREAAEALAEAGAAPRNLRVGAGLGRLELAEEPGAGRGFYRPHSGFPRWQPSDRPQEVLDEALAWAARNDRTDALAALVARGARPDADVYRGTALAWAAACGRVEAIRRLVALGADVNARTTFGGPQHGEGATALHLAAEAGHAPASEALLAAGADRTARDALHHATPADWARHAGHQNLKGLTL